MSAETVCIRVRTVQASLLMRPEYVVGIKSSAMLFPRLFQRECGLLHRFVCKETACCIH